MVDCNRRIFKAEYINGHSLKLFFDDKRIRVVDFSEFIFSSNHPDLKKYRVIGEFLRYEIVDGNLNWDDYAMIFPIDQLYAGKVNLV